MTLQLSKHGDTRMIENYDEKLNKQIEVMKHFPPSVLYQIVIEANEVIDVSYESPLQKEINETAELQICAAFAVEETHSGFAKLARGIIELACAEGLARGKGGN